MERDWRRAGVELALHEVMAEPIVHLVMRRDRLTADDVWAVVEEVRRLQAEAPASPAATFTASEGTEMRPSPLCKVSSLCEGILPLTGAAAALLVLLALLTTLH